MIRKPGRPYGVRIGPGVDPLVVWLGMYLAGEELSSEIIAEKAGLSGCFAGVRKSTSMRPSVAPRNPDPTSVD